MKEHNKEIIQFLTDSGYDALEATWGWYAFIKGVKTEWNTGGKCLVVGFGNSPNDMAKIREIIAENFGDHFLGKCNASIRFQKNPKPEHFYQLVEIIENLPFTLEKPAGQRGKVSLDRTGIFEKMAKQVRFSVENGMPGGLNRGTLQMDSIDDLIIIGESVNRTPENSYREHIIPCDFLICEAVEMVKSGKSNAEIALMFKNSLNIVLITPEEANELNTTLGLKTSMPFGWKIGDDPLARLTAANIHLKS